FQLNLGPGVFWESSLSLGDSVNLGNGTSSSSFYTPARWTQVILFTAYGGIDFQLSRNLSFHLAVIVPEAADPLKRRFHGLVKLGVAL
ncbi:MAG: hypothetical protein EBZ49_16535, partial [Proteobacteria bacterium]|nr:hypothetical protein [Pseudomonadota bacterium]